MREDQFWRLQVGGRVVPVRPDHPFWVESRGWIDAPDLRPGDLLLAHDGQTLPLEDVVPPPFWMERN
jgi:intein/homing endonuclease